VGLFIFLSFATVALFSFVSIVIWAGTRYEERKGFYRSETLKKLAESGPTAVIEYLREEERLNDKQQENRRRRSLEEGGLAGWILLVVGITLTIALHQIIRELPVYLLGLIPLGIGMVLLLRSLIGRHAGASGGH
jgi:hypothetical protein